MTMHPEYRPQKVWRFCQLCCFALWAMSLAPCRVQAQVIAGPTPINHSVPPAPAPIGTETVSVQSNQTPLTVRGPCDPDYWIVSTRNCKEEIACGRACHYEVLRFDGSNQGRCSSMEEFLSSLQPSVPVCFMAHGSFVTWDSMLNDSAETYRWLKQAAPCQPVHIVFYTWASNDGDLLPHIKVNKYGNRSGLNGLYLADVVSKVSYDHPISLIGHSHGARLVAATLHAMAGGSIDDRVLAGGPLPPRRLRVVLAAAAIDRHWLNPNELYGLALCPTEGILNLRDRVDFPLLFYPLRRPFSRPALAITGVSRRNRAEMGDCGMKICDYDVSRLVGLGHLWANYYNQPAIASAIRHYVYFDECQASAQVLR